jgi:hypothetical protein
MATPEVERLTQIINDHEEQINNLQALAAALFIVVRAGTEKMPDYYVKRVAENLGDVFLNTSLSDKTIARAQKYLEAILQHP